ncbi:MAG TPA: peptidoglycan bridge formation glycyltransferase FemA/FemB family protein [Candidatus Saccharimonadales bacterium]|nr:peptidoglycan bridge formation glycyltransferase FemA/FemB family protein [Candidatus Saccharimonadales bacterium]
MADITTKTVDNQTEWENFMAVHHEANFLQSWNWGEFHLQLNHQIIRLGFYENTKLIGVMLAVVEPAKRGRHLVVPAGPIIDWSNDGLVKLWVNELKRLAKDHKCLFARVRPQLIDTPDSRQLFKQLGFRVSPMHVTADLTSQLDLSKTDEELKHSMRKGARYEINRAQKLGIKVEASDDIAGFCKLQLETAKRQQFVPFSTKFLTAQFQTFTEADQAILYKATHNGRLLTMAFIIFYGSEAAYHYGASTDLARELPGAYAIQWAAIHEARQRGCKRYNFWGVTDHGQTKHRFYGVSVFKRGFGGEDVAYLPARDVVVNQAKYAATYIFETGRRKLRRL